jgi:hypothetical protein
LAAETDKRDIVSVRVAFFTSFRGGSIMSFRAKAFTPIVVAVLIASSAGWVAAQTGFHWERSNTYHQHTSETLAQTDDSPDDDESDNSGSVDEDFASSSCGSSAAGSQSGSSFLTQTRGQSTFTPNDQGCFGWTFQQMCAMGYNASEESSYGSGEYYQQTFVSGTASLQPNPDEQGDSTYVWADVYVYWGTNASGYPLYGGQGMFWVNMTFGGASLYMSGGSPYSTAVGWSPDTGDFVKAGQSIYATQGVLAVGSTEFGATVPVNGTATITGGGDLLAATSEDCLSYSGSGYATRSFELEGEFNLHADVP